MPAADASNLRELLKIREVDAEDEHRRNAVARITIAAVLGSEKRHGGGAHMTRTLLDIIRDESVAAGGPASYDGDHQNQNNSSCSRKNWKIFKDRLRLRRAGAAWTSSVHIPTSDVPMQSSSSGGGQISRYHSSRFQTVPSPHPNESIDGPEPPESDNSQQPEQNPPVTQNVRSQISRMSSTRFTRVTFNLDESTHHDDSDESPSPPMKNVRVEPESRRHVTGTRLAAALAAERERSAAAAEEEEEQSPLAETAEEAEGEAPVRMSLMALLEETDRQMGFVGSTYAATAYVEEEDDEDDDDDGEDDGRDRRHGGEFSCCVCMVRHKGAAFIPCGHTFCRLCSRELWVSRGNCPICNGFILEILDIF